MRKFEFLDHTADAKFRAYGNTLEESFRNAGIALSSLVTDVTKVKPHIRKTIKVTSERQESLLFDFLEEFVYLTDTEGFLLHDIESLKISKGADGMVLEAVLLGDKGTYEIFTQIKAITYNDMFIKKEGGIYTVQVVPDI